MSRRLVFCAAVAGAALAAAATAGACGVERWSVKTLTDQAAKQVTGPPIDATIAQLGQRHNDHPSAREAPFETHLYRVRATIVAAKLEADDDVHLVITDGGATMIAEAPALACTRNAQRRWAMNVARQLLDRRLHPTTTWKTYNIAVKLVGVGFLDRPHGQRGVAPNAVELHPITGVWFG